ncbi:MAG: hypothetical protein UY26_C0001G0100 [Candidatus Jorgensenbacteria bacterium GW2011_GWA1_48_13]|nr:MAG: hypothetical protein UY26_C0001G0100 [Candidatus Jorgensenbacteria bacterium GW2011_GWA1_48_13]
MTNYDQIINELRKLRFLKPNRAFAETSKTSILASAKPNHFYGFLSLPRLAPALSFADGLSGFQPGKPEPGICGTYHQRSASGSGISAKR